MIYCVGDCHFYMIKGGLPGNCDTNWARAGSYMKALYSDEFNKGFIHSGFVEWLREKKWKGDDRIIVCLGANDICAALNKWWPVDTEAWLEIYDKWLTEFIDPIPIPKESKALVSLWYQKHANVYQPRLDDDYILEINEGLLELASKHGYRIHDEVEALAKHRKGDQHLTSGAGKIFEDTFKEWKWNAARKGNPGRAKMGGLFVISTGRSGTLTLSKVLSQHPAIRCKFQKEEGVRMLSAQYANRELKYEKVKSAVSNLYGSRDTYDKADSDHKLWNLVTPLSEVLPRSRFIWLIRDGRDVAASFHQHDFWNPERYDENWNVKPGKELYWEQRLVQGDKCGAFSKKAWRSMSQFAKCCWFWQYANDTIREQLEKIPGERWFPLRLEEFNQEKANDLFKFLGVKAHNVDIRRWHKNRKAIAYWPEWDTAKRRTFKKYCKKGMDLWYPGLLKGKWSALEIPKKTLKKAPESKGISTLPPPPQAPTDKMIPGDEALDALARTAERPRQFRSKGPPPRYQAREATLKPPEPKPEKSFLELNEGFLSLEEEPEKNRRTMA